MGYVVSALQQRKKSEGPMREEDGEVGEEHAVVLMLRVLALPTLLVGRNDNGSGGGG